MTFEDTVQWMFSKLPMYQRVGEIAYRANLNNSLLVDNHLNHPHKNYKSIHVAGTNGKGSTCHMLASIYQEAGLKVGLFTSPHLKDFRERIKINGKMVSKDFVIEFILNNKKFLEAKSVSFFEMTSAMAFSYFSNENIDLAIIETGLGGRLDSTNIITPVISVITNIGYDHTQFLGNSLEEIALEKAGIIKPKVPVVIGEYHKNTSKVFKQVALQKESDIFFVKNHNPKSIPTDLMGNYQKKNIATVLIVLQLWNSRFQEIEKDTILKGIGAVIKNTGLKGRWEILQHNPKIICDTAHNKEGLSLVFMQLEKEKFKDLHIVVGFVKDKDLSTVVNLFPQRASYYFCKPDVPRGLDAKLLQQYFERNGRIGEVFPSVVNALQTAKKNANSKDLIFVGGSTFTVAEII